MKYTEYLNQYIGFYGVGYIFESNWHITIYKNSQTALVISKGGSTRFVKIVDIFDDFMLLNEIVYDKSTTLTIPISLISTSYIDG